MNRRFKNFLQTCNQATVDETVLDDLRREMEQAVPEIAESIRQRETLAAKLRIDSTKTAVAVNKKRD